MAIEATSMLAVGKPWGSIDLSPWSTLAADAPIGELWVQRSASNTPDPALLLKLLFTSQPLSIQVHPDDTLAHSLGLANGKTEAWYILAAKPGAEVAVGLKRKVNAPELKAAIADGSVAELVQWHPVVKDQVIFVPAGTIHAIGPGLVIAEIQQRSDATFRLFDHGRQRELHADSAIAAARAEPAGRQPSSHHLTAARTLLVACPHFVLERFDLPAGSSWQLHAKLETWLLVLDGGGQIGGMAAGIGEAIYLQAESADVTAGERGLKGLLAYPAPAPVPDLLHRRAGQSALAPAAVATPALSSQAMAGSHLRSTEA